MNYLEINPLTNIAIGGVYQKYENTTDTYDNYRPKSDDAGVGWLWNPEDSSWTEPDQEEHKFSLVEAKELRNQTILSTDWESLRYKDYQDNPNYTITEEDEILHGKYMTYRQELRDMLKDYVPVSVINWPTLNTGQ